MLTFCHETPRLAFAQHGLNPGFARVSSLSNHYKYDALAPVNFAIFIKFHLLQLLFLQSSSSSSSSSFQAFISYIFSHFNGKKKIVLKLEFQDDKTKQKAMKNVCSHLGVESASVDTKEKKLTVVGDVDIIIMVKQLRKLCHTDLVTVGSPA